MNNEAKEKTDYIRRLEKDYISYIVDFTDDMAKRAELNKKKFSFISEKEFSNCIGFNENYQYASRNVKQMQNAFSLIVGRIKGLESYIYEKEYEPWVYESMKTLLRIALDFGYCDEALEVVELLKNPKINSEQSQINVSSAILKVMENYAKRTILEDESNFKLQAEKLIKEVDAGKFGQDTKVLLPVEKMAWAYNKAKIVDNDGVIYMLNDKISEKDLKNLNLVDKDRTL